MAIVAKFTRTLPAPTAAISGGFVFLLSAGWFTQASTGAAGSPIDGGTNSLVSGGGDMQIFSDTGATTRLPIEVVSFVTGGSPSAQVWVRTPNYTSGDAITIGKDDTQTVQPVVGAAFGRNATWADYSGVWHLENGTGDSIDATGNSDLTRSGSVTATVGKIGNSNFFNGGASLNINSDLSSADMTISGWFKSSSNSSDNVIFAIADSGSLSEYFSLSASANEAGLPIRAVKRSGPFIAAATTTGFSFNTWTYATATFSSNGTYSALLNGGSKGTNYNASTPSLANPRTSIGALLRSSSVNAVSTDIDSVMLRFEVLSDEQILSNYLNQNDPDNFGTSSEYILVGGGSPIVAIDPIDQTQSIGQLTLTQQSSISIGGLAQAQSIEQITLQASGTLSLNNLEQVQSIEQVNLTQAHIISVDSVEQSQELYQVSLLVAGTLSVNNASQTQTLEQTVLSVIASLAINDITQSQEVEQVILTAFNGSAVSIASIDQAQNIDAVTLSQLNVVSVDNLSQSQLLQAVNFNGVVVGYLQGVLTIISAYNGRIKLTNPLTGEIRIL